MPTTFPQRRRGRINNWHYAGMVAGYLALTGGFLLFMLNQATPPAPKLQAGITTGAAPADQNDKPALNQ